MHYKFTVHCFQISLMPRSHCPGVCPVANQDESWRNSSAFIHSRQYYGPDPVWGKKWSRSVRGVTVSLPWTCSSCLFATVLPGGLTVEIRFMPEEPRWCPGISQCCFAAQYVPVSPDCLIKYGSTQCIPIIFRACRCRYGVVPVGPGVHTVATPGLTLYWQSGSPTNV